MKRLASTVLRGRLYILFSQSRVKNVRNVLSRCLFVQRSLLCMYVLASVEFGHMCNAVDAKYASVCVFAACFPKRPGVLVWTTQA